MQVLATLRAAIGRARRRARRRARHVTTHWASLALNATTHWAWRGTVIEPRPLGVGTPQSLRGLLREQPAQWVYGQRVDAWHRWARRRYAAPIGHPFPEAPQTHPSSDQLRDLLSARHHTRRTVDALWAAGHNWSRTDPQMVPIMRRLLQRLRAVDRGLPLKAAERQWGDTDPTTLAHLRRAMAFTYGGYRLLTEEPDTWVATALLVQNSEMLATEILHQTWIRLSGEPLPDTALQRPMADAPGPRAAWTQTDDWWADLRRLAFAVELEPGRAALWATPRAQAAMLPPPPGPGTPDDILRLLQSPWAPIRLSAMAAMSVAPRVGAHAEGAPESWARGPAPGVEISRTTPARSVAYRARRPGERP